MNEPEADDSTIYSFMHFGRDTFDLFLRGLDLYESAILGGVDLVKADPELAPLVDEDTLDDGAPGEELRRVRNTREFLTCKSTMDGRQWVTVDRISHGQMRFLKSIARLSIDHCRRRRDLLARNPKVSRALLATLDAQLLKMEERAGMGVFATATPWPLLFPPELAEPISEDAPAPELPFPPRRRAVPQRIGIRDSELRRRCVDLLLQFSEDDHHDRLDDVVGAATKVLEVRIRALSGAPTETVGMKLADHAFGGTNPRIKLSQVRTEQEAGHALFRGVFGFVRNPVHHRLIESLDPERALQILGMIDYLIFVVEAATNAQPGAQPPAAPAQ